jgi:murein DD-endopeptidase MepM/ murein hydrolase activator NlpD
MRQTLWAIGLLAMASPAEASVRQVLNRRIEPGQTLSRALSAAGVPDAQLERIISAMEGVFDFRRSRVGDQLRISTRGAEIDFIDYRQSAQDEWQVRRDGDRFVATKREVEIEKKVGVVELRIDSSLYEAAIAAGEDPALPIALADVFAWDIDFYQDVRKGDRVRAVIEKFVSKGRLVRYGEVLATAYQGQSVGQKKVFRYQLSDGNISYFMQDGTSARKAFLKSPLKYANITSRFGSRLHPVLHYQREHNGIDYRAPVGTPVWAVGDGTVTRAGYDGGSGKNLCIRHINALETCYLHLSGFGAGIRAGVRVVQKQVVAYTGNTGLSTGPHLHFALKRGGRFVNPLNQKFPRADPIPQQLRPDFSQRIAPWVAQLEGEPLAAASAPAP